MALKMYIYVLQTIPFSSLTRYICTVPLQFTMLFQCFDKYVFSCDFAILLQSFITPYWAFPWAVNFYKASFIHSIGIPEYKVPVLDSFLSVYSEGQPG